ncbi:MAG: hypothetical protein IJX17_08415 [Clostridia bacterium]|nr:hypothetical protein [Clostridia bacterium]
MINFCILSQDKRNLVQGNQIGTNDESNSILLLDNIRLEDSKYGLIIGTYENLDRVNEIIKDIFKKSENLNSSILFYEMPEK